MKKALKVTVFSELMNTLEAVETNWYFVCSFFSIHSTVFIEYSFIELLIAAKHNIALKQGYLYQHIVYQKYPFLCRLS